ncbi:hypothetical protein RFI_04936 [Reticulomyxa filosa]|uniref:Uncharacterized protein n=1 Tax=Reticulomyxa filosa TaxID=46433 RepID=X6P3N2_RETFI|nr:hypothetical protein RFI_04936 [Reticulomyxa filosa]|eukprot:ETO32182.1 hypothetical protein RFI_04936 [Reticulomyxa filosa]
MKLAIIGQENLDELTKYAEGMFADIKDNERKTPVYSKEVFDSNTFPVLLKVTPVKEKRELTIAWPMESCEQYFLERPHSLLAFCLGDEGPGLGYATELTAGMDYNTPQFSLFRVGVALTPEGLANWERVVEIIYRYIAKMNEVTEERWQGYWEERKKVKKMGFEFKSKEAPYNYATNLAQSAYLFPPDHLLECMSGLYFKCDTVPLPFFFKKKKKTDNCMIQLVAKELEPECKEREQWYGTLYQKVKLTSEQLGSWKHLRSNKDDGLLHTPPPNPYIADDFSLYCETTCPQQDKDKDKKGKDEKWLGPIPQVVVTNDQLKLWFKMDQYFKQPKLGVKFKIFSPVAGDTCANRMKSSLLFTCFHNVMSEYTYVFTEAGLSSNVDFDGVSGINVEFFGYNQKLPVLVDTVLSKLTHFNLTKVWNKSSVKFKAFEKQKRSNKWLCLIIIFCYVNQLFVWLYVCCYVNSSNKRHCFFFFLLLLSHRNPQGFSLEEMEEEVNKITYEDLMAHYRQLFAQVFVEGLVYGNAEAKQATDTYSHLIDKHLLKNKTPKIYPPKDILAARKGSLKVPANGYTHALRFENFNSDDNNNAIGNDYFFAIDTPKDWAVLKLMAHMTSVPCFDQLRTKEQLGYLVWSFSDIARGLMSFRVTIQSVVADPIKLDERVELFLQDFRKQLAATNKDTFESNKEGVVNDLLEKTKGVGQQFGEYWNELENWRYQFERRENVAQEIKKLTLENILEFYDEYILGSKGTRSKLSVQCFGKDFKIPEEKTHDLEKNKVYLLTPLAIPEFKDKCGYYPFPYSVSSKL